MHSKRFTYFAFSQSANLCLIGTFIAGFVTGQFGLPSAYGQENSGVKIDLTLSPPKPAEVPKKTDEKPAEKSADESTPKVESQATASPAQVKGPFVLSAFQVTTVKTDKTTKDSAATAQKGTTGTLTLEQPAAPTSKQTKTPESDAVQKSPKETELGASNSIPAAVSKSTDVKPLKIDKRKDPSNNEDASGAECPGGVEGEKPLPAMPDDVPLEQEEHPYDAPAAESTSNKPDRPANKVHRLDQPIALSGEQLRLRTEINQLLRYYIQHPETIARRSPWAVMHAILPYGVEAELLAGNRRVNAIGWMSYNGLCKTQRIFQPTKYGFRTNLGPGVQGHEGQYLAILAQSKVAPTYPIKVGNRTYSINDLVRLEMATCREKSELTFKLLGLSYYLEQDQRWRDNQGGNWSLEKLVAEELEQPIIGAACGGTHRLMGLTFSLLQRKQAGLPIDGHWSRSEQFLSEFAAYAFTLQNPDGSFSTEWFEARANEPDVERKVQTTGHILEWLIYTLPDEQLQSSQIQNAIRYLLNTIGAEPGRDWPIGPRGHSLRALALYNQRVFGAPPGKLKQYMATLNTESKQR